MLSAKDLFKYRQGLDKTIPQRGGDKDFLPDGSWLEDKKLEQFMVERHHVLAEPRIQRDGDLVKGEWNPERRLVEFKREMRNFWEHMGFVDSQRKWLFPEEALFLMETNVMEVMHNGLPLSVMEGYMIFFDKSITLEYYQVFAHLRRVGYVVLRHQGRLKITKYEQQIGLDKSLSRKERKALSRKQHKKAKFEEGIEVVEDDVTNKSADLEINVDKVDIDEEMDIDMDIEQDIDMKDKASDNTVGTNMEDKGKGSNKTSVALDSVSETSRVLDAERKTPHTETDSCNIESSQIGEPMNVGQLSVPTQAVEQITNDNSGSVSSSLNMDKWNRNFIDMTGQKVNYPFSQWNFDHDILFPDFGCEGSVIVISQPTKDKAPGEVETKQTTYIYFRNKHINKKKEKGKNRKEESSRNVKFSNRMMSNDFNRNSFKSCRNWSEYKLEKKRRNDFFIRKEALPHLFDKIEPLVKPEQASSTMDVLKQLQNITEESKTQDRYISRPELLPHFDVYKPDVKFRKSSPGVPDHRVVVARCSDPMPDLSVVSSISGYLGDEVPLNWAVVESGNIAFYTVSDFSLPLDISLG